MLHQAGIADGMGEPQQLSDTPVRCCRAVVYIYRPARAGVSCLLGGVCGWAGCLLCWARLRWLRLGYFILGSDRSGDVHLG